MRLGAYRAILDKHSKSCAAYGCRGNFRAHRHRYEFNNAYRELFADKPFHLAGLSPDGRLVEIIEVSDHPWFVGVQFIRN